MLFKSFKNFPSIYFNTRKYFNQCFPSYAQENPDPLHKPGV